MNKQLKLPKVIAPIVLGIGLSLGLSIPAKSHPHYSDSHSNYHQQSFIEIQPFRSLNVTPRYYNRSSRYDSRYYNRDNYYPRQRRVHRRGFRNVDSHRRYRNYRPDGTYIRIRIK